MRHEKTVSGSYGKRMKPQEKIYIQTSFGSSFLTLSTYLHVKQYSKVYEADLAKMLVLTASLFTTSIKTFIFTANSFLLVSYLHISYFKGNFSEFPKSQIYLHAQTENWALKFTCSDELTRIS